MNDRGEVVGVSYDVWPGGTPRAFLWRDGRAVDLGTLGGASAVATGINQRGQVVGYSETSSGDIHAFLWQDGRMTDLGTLGGLVSRAVAINERGQIVGNSATSTGESHGVLWALEPSARLIARRIDRAWPARHARWSTVRLHCCD